MAEARALLRAERASRRITHPHASYTSDGKLLCNLCETLVKSEAQWQSHLHSTQHNLRSQRQQTVIATKAPSGEAGGKKRKADSIESPPQERKKAKAEVEPQGVAKHDTEKAVVVEERTDGPVNVTTGRNGTAAPTPAQPKETDLDADEVAAFERELASLEADAKREDDQARQVALRDAATISAAPMTAEELAAQAREEQSAQRGKRDLELENEREDAARVLEEEMEEMEGLEERVRKLRERREKLRLEGSPDAVGGSRPGDTAATEVKTADDRDGMAGEAESSDEDDEDDFDEWKFGGS